MMILFKYYIAYTGFLFAVVHINTINIIIIFIVAICSSFFDKAMVSNYLKKCLIDNISDNNNNKDLMKNWMLHFTIK